MRATQEALATTSITQGKCPDKLHQRAHAIAQPADRDEGTYHGQALHPHRSPISDRGVPGRQAHCREGPRL